MRRVVLAMVMAAAPVYVVGVMGVPPASAQQNCDSSYPDFCIPPKPPDLNCPDIGVENFTALAPDPHGLDGNDKDGIACENPSTGRDHISDPSRGPAQALAAQQGGGGATAGGSGTPAVTNCGAATVGQTVACDLSGLPANTAVTKFVNGTGGEPGTSSATGTVHISVQVLSQTSGILGDPKSVTLQCGTNTLSATGGGVTSSGTFTLACPAAVPAASPSSSVAFTGADIALGTTAGSALVATGAFLVWGARRRRAA